MFSLPDVAIGSITAALIAGFVFFLGSILSKDQKVSDFRQAWIDALREDVSKLIANANVIAGFRAISGATATHYEIFKDTCENYSAINEAESSIMMRLNPKEKLSKAVLDTLKEHEILLGHSMPDINYEALTSTQKKLVSQMNLVFKQEWKRVKRGEPIYVFTKWAIIATFVVTLSYAATRFVVPEINYFIQP